MQERIQDELTLIRQWFPDVEYREEGRWFLVPSYPLPEGWNREMTDVVFQVDAGYPVTQLYGIYVPVGLRFQDAMPGSYTEPVSNQPPFEGTWGQFSWYPDEGFWMPSADVHKGANLLDWVRGFRRRFEEGR